MYTKRMRGREFYREIRRPRWAPPAWLFAPVWTALYAIIAITYGYVGYLFSAHELPLGIVLPFILNLVFNLLYSPIQFGLRNFILGSVDIFFVLATLLWELYVIYPFVPWVAYMNIPYLIWVSFATVLQLAVTKLNAA